MKNIIWLREQSYVLEEFDSANISDKHIFTELFKLDDDELKKALDVFNSTNQRDNPSFGFKKIITSILDSNLINVDLFDNDFLVGLLEIKFQIGALNQEVERADEYLKMTFDSSISEVNHKIIRDEIYRINLAISGKAIYIVEKINCLIN